MMNILVMLLVIIAVIFMIAYIYEKKQLKQDDELEAGWNPKTTVRTSYDSYTLSSDYGSEVRYLDGRPLRTMEDLLEWKIIMGHERDIFHHLRDLEKIIGGYDEKKARQAYARWDLMYGKYRNTARRHRLWNNYVAEKIPFTGSPEQLLAEETNRQRVKLILEENAEKRERYKLARSEILAYVNHSKGDARSVTQMQKAVFPDKANKTACKIYRDAYKSLQEDGYIREISKQRGKTIQKSHKAVNKPEEKEITLEEFAGVVCATYRPQIYRDIDLKVRLRAKHTVSAPVKLNREKNTCQFISETTGDVYITSLEACTCPAYAQGIRPCKHMVKLESYIRNKPLEP